MSKEEWLAQKAKRDQEKAEEEAAVNARRQQAAACTPPTVPSKAPPKYTVKASSASSPAAGRGPTAAPKAPKSVRPADFSEWKRDDYYSARRDGDSRLIAAVVYLGQQFVGKESAAELIGRLIDMPTADPKAGDDGEDLPKPSRAANPKLIEAAIGALIANGTAHARQILDRLLSQSLAMNSQAAAAITKTLLAHPSPNNEDLLFRMVTAPEPETFGDRGAVASRSGRQMSMVELRSVASEEFRVRLARHMSASETSPAVYARLWDIIKAPRPENLAAQILLYRSTCLDRATQRQMEQWFASQSGEALIPLMGIRSPKQAGVALKATASADPLCSAGLFWDPGFSAVVQRRLPAIEDLEKGSRLLALASTLPLPLTRTALLRTLEKHWEEGPSGLKILGDSAGMPFEPGFVALVKMLPRKDLGMPGFGGEGEGNVPASRAKSGKLASVHEVRQRHDQTAQQWMQFSRDVVLNVCQRFRTAAQAEQATGRQRALNADLPFKNHPSANVVALHRFDWPEGLPHKMAETPSLRLRFARIEQKAIPNRVVAFYRRQFPNAKEHAIPGGSWIDSLDRGKKQAGVCSVDVLITKIASNIPSLPNEEQELVVDVLVIECIVNAELF